MTGIRKWGKLAQELIKVTPMDLTLAIANIYLDGPGPRPTIALHQARNALHCVYSTQAGIRAVRSFAKYRIR